MTEENGAKTLWESYEDHLKVGIKETGSFAKATEIGGPVFLEKCKLLDRFGGGDATLQRIWEIEHRYDPQWQEDETEPATEADNNLAADANQ